MKDVKFIVNGYGFSVFICYNENVPPSLSIYEAKIHQYCENEKTIILLYVIRVFKAEDKCPVCFLSGS